MTLRKAIKLHCFDCAGESSKEVTLCCAFDCALWPHRTGESPSSYRLRMQAALKNYAADFREMERAGIDTSPFRRPPVALSAGKARNLHGPGQKGPKLAPEMSTTTAVAKNSAHPGRGAGEPA